MTTIYECKEQVLTTNQKNSKKNVKSAHNHPIQPEYSRQSNSDSCYDRFVCTNKKDMKKWLECAKKHGECNGITYIPKKTSKFLLFFSKTIPAKYTYKAKFGDTPEIVREMFNLKPGALRKHDEYIFSIHEPYPTGKIIEFDEDDIMQ